MDQTGLTKKEYDRMVKKASPNSHMALNCAKAFVTGGIICTIGQLIMSIFENGGVSKDDTAVYTLVILIFAGAVLTGFSLYDRIGEFGGAGSVVPITGFANSVAAPAIEFKKEGFIFGVGAKIFVIAGPVIVYGTLTSVVVGTVYYIIKVMLNV